MRPVQVRRALQWGRHVRWVCPPDQSPDITYEAAMIQSDTRRVLLPILPGALHPGIQRLGVLIQTMKPGPGWLIQWDRECGSASDAGNQSKEKPLAAYFPGWEVLQTMGGPIAEISAFAEHSERMIGAPLLRGVRFEKRG